MQKDRSIWIGPFFFVLIIKESNKKSIAHFFEELSMEY